MTNVMITPETLFAKYGQKCIEADALRERVDMLEKELMSRDEVALNNNRQYKEPGEERNAAQGGLFETGDKREHTNGA